MLDKYHEEYKQIPVPANLKAETLLKMETENKKKYIGFIIKISVVIASVVIVSILTYSFLQPQYIKTKLKDDSIVANVELSDGKLYFEQVDTLKNFGGLFTNRKEMTEQQTQEYFNIQVPTTLMDGYTLDSKKQYGYYKDFSLTKIEVEEVYSKDNQEITIRYQKKEELITTNSTIDGHAISIAYKMEDNQIVHYSTLYQEANIVYEIEAKAMSQEQYISCLATFLKKFK